MDSKVSKVDLVLACSVAVEIVMNPPKSVGDLEKRLDVLVSNRQRRLVYALLMEMSNMVKLGDEKEVKSL